MTATYIFSNQTILDSSGDPIVGAKLESFAAGTTSPLSTFADDGVTSNANPANGATTGNQVSDSDGRFGNIYLQAASYKFVLKDDAGGTLWTHDDYNPDGGSFVLGDVPDDVFRIVDNGDSTKKIAFEASGITTGTTRTFDAPDGDGTLALTALTQTLTNKTIDLTDNTVTGTLAEFNTAVSDATLVSLTGSETLTNKTLTSPTLTGTPVYPTDADRDNYLDALSPSRRPNVKDDFGATGDGYRGTNGGMTASSSTFTTVSNAFVAGDVGKLFTIDGAGVAGAELSTTIATFISSGSVTLTVAASTTVSSATFTFGTDDLAALQAALDANVISEMPPGLYCTSGELVLGVVQRSSGLIGIVRASENSYTTQAGGPGWAFRKEPVIVYCGAPTNAASPKSVLRVSSAATGTEPAQTFDGITYAGPLDQVRFDSNKRAYVGVYFARVSGVDIGHIYCSNSIGHNFLMAHCFSGTVKLIYSTQSQGCGITIGSFETTDGTTQTWPADWTTASVNSVKFGYLQSSGSGQDGTFDETSNPRWGFGVGVFSHRANMYDTILAEANDGPGLYMSPTSGPNVVETLYTELNCTVDRVGQGSSSSAVDEGRASDGYSIWFEGVTGGASQHAAINNVFAYQSRIKLTGTEPARFPEAALSLGNIANGDGIYADWDNYRLDGISIDLANDIVGHLPAANVANSISLTTPLTTWFVRSGGSDSNDGRTSGNAFLTVQKAIDMAKICTDVTTFDCASTTLINQTLDLRGLERDITLSGGTFNQSASLAIALNVKGGLGSCKLTMASITQLQSILVDDANVEITSLTTHESGHAGASAGYLVTIRNGGILAITASGVVADANGARGVLINGGSKLIASNSWYIDNATIAANLGCIASDGGGQVVVNYDYSSTNAAWLKNFNGFTSYSGEAVFADQHLSFRNKDTTPSNPPSGATGTGTKSGTYVRVNIQGTEIDLLREDGVGVAGTWTPIVSDGTNTVSPGVAFDFIRIGNMVTVFIPSTALPGVNNTSVLSGDLKLTGFPLQIAFDQHVFMLPVTGTTGVNFIAGLARTTEEVWLYKDGRANRLTDGDLTASNLILGGNFQIKIT